MHLFVNKKKTILEIYTIHIFIFKNQSIQKPFIGKINKKVRLVITSIYCTVTKKKKKIWGWSVYLQYGFQKELIFNVIKGSSEIWFNVMHKRKLEFLALVG